VTIDFDQAARESEVQHGGPKTRRPFNSDEHRALADLDRRAALAVAAEIAETEQRLAKLREQLRILVGFCDARVQISDELDELPECAWCGAEIDGKHPPGSVRGEVFCTRAHRDASARAVRVLLDAD